MSITEGARKLHFIINEKRPELSRVVDAETGQTFLNISAVELAVTAREITALITVSFPHITVEAEA